MKDITLKLPCPCPFPSQERRRAAQGSLAVAAFLHQGTYHHPKSRFAFSGTTAIYIASEKGYLWQEIQDIAKLYGACP